MMMDAWVDMLELMARHLPSEICPYCGYALRGLPRGHVCPECGVACDPGEIVLFGRDPTKRNPPPSAVEVGGFLVITGGCLVVLGVTGQKWLGMLMGVGAVILWSVFQAVWGTSPTLSPLTPMQLRLSRAGFGLRWGLGAVKMKPWKRAHRVSLEAVKGHWRLRVEVPGRIPGIVWARPVNFAFGAPPEAAEGLREIGRRLAEGKKN